MERKLVNTSILFLLFVFTFGCSDGGPTISDEGGSAIIGKIVDSNGNPLEGVGIHYIPKLVDIAPSEFAKITPSTTIDFSIPEPSKVTIYILRYGSRDTVAVVMQSELVAAGNHRVEYNVGTITNGVYFSVIEYDDKHIENKMLFFRYPADLSNTIPLTHSSKMGKFELPYNILGIGEDFTFDYHLAPSEPAYVSNEIVIVFTWGLNNYYVEDLVVDKFINVEKTFTLPIN